MPTIVALIACAILVGLAILQLSLVRGAPLGRFVWVDSTTSSPQTSAG